MVDSQEIEYRRKEAYTSIDMFEKSSVGLQMQLVKTMTEKSRCVYFEHVRSVKPEHPEFVQKFGRHLRLLKTISRNLWYYRPSVRDSRLLDEVKELINNAKDALLGIADTYEEILSSYGISSINSTTNSQIPELQIS